MADRLESRAGRRLSAVTAWRSFLEAHARITAELEYDLQEQRGIPLSWYDVLVQLSEAPNGRLRMQELAASVLLSKSGLTRLFDRMENAGLVRREPCETDARGIVAAITPAGRATLRSAAPVHLRGVHSSFARHLTNEEARTLDRAFGKMLAALGAESRASA